MFFGSAACGCTSLLPSACAIASAVVTASCIALCASHGGDCPQAGHVGAAVWIGVDMALGRFHLQGLDPDILGVGHNPDRDDGMAEAVLGRLAIAGLDLRRNALRVRGHALDPRASEDGEAL